MDRNPNARNLHNLLQHNGLLPRENTQPQEIDWTNLKASIATVAPSKFPPKFGYPPKCPPTIPPPPLYNGPVQGPLPFKAEDWEEIGTNYPGPQNRSKRRRKRQRNSHTVKRRAGYIEGTLKGNYVLHGKREKDVLRNLKRTKKSLLEAQFQKPFYSIPKRAKNQITDLQRRLHCAIKVKQSEVEIRQQFHRQLKVQYENLCRRFAFEDVSDEEDFPDDDNAPYLPLSDFESISDDEFSEIVPEEGEIIEDGEIAPEGEARVIQGGPDHDADDNAPYEPQSDVESISDEYELPEVLSEQEEPLMEEGEIIPDDEARPIQESKMNHTLPKNDPVPEVYLRTLFPNQHISTAIIDNILCLLGSHETSLSVFPLQVGFYEGRHHKSRSRYFKKVNFEAYDLILVPILQKLTDNTNHWILLKLDFTAKTCEILDSMYGFRFGYSEAEAVLKMVTKKAVEDGNHSLPDLSKFQILKPVLQYQLPASNDCGLFLMMWAIQSSLGIPSKSFCYINSSDREIILEMVSLQKLVVPAEYTNWLGNKEFRKIGYFT